ncbi:MAG: hypothetical protein CMO68_06115 [Verrucomicrobiales bacterium]|nr:hypothetical protein [Verrucomicrobiales bacterium]
MASVSGQSDQHAPRPAVGQLLGPRAVKFVATAPQWPPIPSFNQGQTPTLLEAREAQKVGAFIANWLFYTSGQLVTGSPDRNRFELTQTPRGNDLQLWIQTDLIFDNSPQLGGGLHVNGHPIFEHGRDIVIHPHGRNALKVQGGEGWPGTLRLGGPPSSRKWIAIQCPSSPDNTVYVWPAADGTSGQVLTTDGSGALSWGAGGGGGGYSYWKATADVESAEVDGEDELIFESSDGALAISLSSAGPVHTLDFTHTIFPIEQINVDGTTGNFTLDTDNYDVEFLSSDGSVTIDCSNQGQIDIEANKSAIVPGPGRDQYVGLQCVETPDVRFEDVVEIETDGREFIEHELDPTFVHVCEPGSIKCVGHSCSDPAIVGVRVEGASLLVKFSPLTPPPETIVLKVSGVRAGRSGQRFPEYTEDEALANNAFWQSWRPAE